MRHHAEMSDLTMSRGSRGASAIEYGLLVALIAVVCIVAVFFFGNETSQSFTSTGSSITNPG